MTLAWHFTSDKLRDGRPIPALGETLVHEGAVEICASGLHASERAADALKYAPGPLLHRVRCEDIVARHDDKLVCRRRTILASIDATHLLRRFAADQALSVAHLWDMPDVVQEYLTTLDEGKRDAAWAAAWAAAWDAAWDAARAATRDAAWAAARAAGPVVAWDAAMTATRDATRDAAWDAARDAARADFDRRVASAFGDVQ